MKGWGPELCARRTDITMAMVDTFLTNTHGGVRADVATAPVCAHKRRPRRVFNWGERAFRSGALCTGSAMFSCTSGATWALNPAAVRHAIQAPVGAAAKRIASTRPQHPA